MNLIKRELKSKRKTLIIWIIIIVSFALLGFGEGGAFVGDTSIAMQDMLDSMPEELLHAFSMENFDLSTANGYYGIMTFYFALALGIYSVMTSCSTIVSEERDKTAEFSLVLPIRRHHLLSAKMLVVFLYGVGLNIISLLCAFAFGAMVEAQNGYYDFVLLSSVATLLIQVLFMAVGFLVGCVFKNHKKAGSLSVSILLATYFFSVLSGIHKNLEFFKYLTPFEFFDFYKILDTGTIPLGYTLITLGLSVLFMTLGYIGYGRRDIRI